MKFTLTITDMTREDVADIAGRLGAQVIESVQPVETEEAPVATEEPNPAVFKQQPAEAPKEQPASPAADTATAPAGSTETPTSASAPADPTTAPSTDTGVALAPATTNPEISIPWDARIHAGSKATLAKKPHGWKMKRGIDEATVQQVEAELIAAMAASPANPVSPPADPVPAAAPPTTAAAVTQPANPAPAPAPATGISTFPELMAAITGAAIDQATVTAAVNKQGLQSLPLLASRPDLIPAVAAELFPGA